MPHTLLGLVTLLLAPAVADDPKADAPAPAHRAFDSDSPLAEGWPNGTPPGTVEVKRYPGYRSAINKAKGASMNADGVLFFPLFNHISRKNIAMTTPVVSTYAPALIETPGATGEVSMEFIYRSPQMGELGRDRGNVEVVDHEPATYVCLGLQGRMDNARFLEGVKTLKAWIAEHEGEWVEAGPVRRLGYHGPMTPVKERLWEVQIPIKPVGKAPAASPDGSH